MTFHCKVEQVQMIFECLCSRTTCFFCWYRQKVCFKWQRGSTSIVMYIFIQFVISLCEHYILFIFLFFDNIICASCSHAEKLKESVRKDETAKKNDLACRHGGINCQGAPSCPATRVSIHFCMCCPGYHFQAESTRYLPPLCMSKFPFDSCRPWVLPY